MKIYYKKEIFIIILQIIKVIIYFMKVLVKENYKVYYYIHLMFILIILQIFKKNHQYFRLKSLINFKLIFLIKENLFIMIWFNQFYLKEILFPLLLYFQRI